MALSTLRPAETPRNRVYGRAKQYFDISAPGAYTHGSVFLPSPAINPYTIDNWSHEDEQAFNARLAARGSKMILTTKKRFDLKWWLKNPNALIP
jgi:hypothetical protein